MSYRVGTGYDIHRLVPDRPLVLGGVTIKYEKGLLGHSDGDVIIHAVCDAILGALSMGDIGEWYPDTAKETAGIYSLSMLTEIMDKIDKDYEVINIDINCICEKPKLSGFRKQMIQMIAQAVKLDPTAVSVKFRTHEGLGEIGTGNAIAAQTVVLINKR
jgi:2-C-methyl-D-erythritol 2,4-cyclodiphosphate synthase